MFFYVGKTFTSTANGRRIVTVSCEKCRREFYYELARQGKGYATAPYSIGTASARRRAEALAQKDLKRKLERDSELVPCPDCHWVNETMIRSYRRMRYRGLGRYGYVVGMIVAIVTMLTLACMAIDRPPRSISWTLAAAEALAAGVIWALPLFVLRYLLRCRIRPNRRYPSPPVLPPGTPKAWTAEELASPAKVSDKYEPSEDAGTPEGEWAMFRAGHLVIPKQCCECLAPAVTVYKSFFTLNNRQRLQAPLCGECASRLRWQWWTTALLTAGGAALASGVLFVVAQGDQASRVVTAVGAGIGVLLLALSIIPNRVTQPFKMRTVDGDRSIFRIKFRSEQYTE